MRRWLGLVPVALVTAALGASGPAAALEPGVTVDPNSPAGKEYSFPLGVLRSQGAGHRSAPAGVAQPLFGVGIASAGSSAGAAGVSGQTRRTAGQPGRTGARRRRGSAGAPIGGTGSGDGGAGSGRPQISQQQLVRLAQPGSAVPAVALVTALVIAVGLALGAGARRLRWGS